MPYGSKRDYRKIDLFAVGGFLGTTSQYLGTTSWSKTCREAVARLVERNPDYGSAGVKVSARFNDRPYR